MKKKVMEDGTVRVQAWECLKPDHHGMFVYTPGIAVEKMREGFDIAILVINRHPDGTNTFDYGVIL